MWNSGGDPNQLEVISKVRSCLTAPNSRCYAICNMCKCAKRANVQNLHKFAQFEMANGDPQEAVPESSAAERAAANAAAMAPIAQLGAPPQAMQSQQQAMAAGGGGGSGGSSAATKNGS